MPMKGLLGLVVLAVIVVIWLVKRASQVGASHEARIGEAARVGLASQRQPVHALSDAAAGAVRICSELIGFQLNATRCPPYRLSHDRWALGYIWGFLDGVMQRMSIDTDADRSAAYSTYFLALFTDPDVSATLFALAVRSQGMRAFDEGAKKGGEDAFQTIDMKTPMFGLSEHLFA